MYVTFASLFHKCTIWYELGRWSNNWSEYSKITFHKINQLFWWGCAGRHALSFFFFFFFFFCGRGCLCCVVMDGIMVVLYCSCIILLFSSSFFLFSFYLFIYYIKIWWHHHPSPQNHLSFKFNSVPSSIWFIIGYHLSYSYIY